MDTLEIRIVPLNTPRREWLCTSAGAGPIIKNVCGCHPSNWDGKACKDVMEQLAQGISELFDHPERHRGLEPLYHKCTVEDVHSFLNELYDLCVLYEDAIIEVTY